MPTNFPTSVDNFSNPSSNDSLNAPSHSLQHANANDAIEAVEASLLPGGVGYGGLVLITPTGATGGTVDASGVVTIGNAVPSVTVSGAFSATYNNYLIQISNGVASANAGLRLQMGATATGYYNNTISLNAGSGITGANDANVANFINAGKANTSQLYMNATVINPFLAKATTLTAMSTGDTITSPTLSLTGGQLNNTISYTDFTIIPSTGTMTGGTIAVYGYRI